MFEKLIYAGVVFMGFAAIMNPIAAVSIFLTLTSHESENNAKKIAFKSTLTAFLVVVVFALIGHYLLELFRVSFTAMRLAGGIIVALIGYEMLEDKQSACCQPMNETIEKTFEEKEEEGSIAITPLGVPLLAGPGVIITAMNFSSGGFVNLSITIIAFGILCLITYFVLVSGKKIKKIIGTGALKVVTRMMGLILAVIGMQIFLEGVYTAIREFSP